jgi:hypothetical protein
MGSRLASSLLSVNACGSSQGESRQDVIFRQKSADLRSESVSGSPGWKYTPEVVKVDVPILFHFQSFSSDFPVIYQTFYKNLFPVRYHVKRLEKDCTFFPGCVILEKTENTRR